MDSPTTESVTIVWHKLPGELPPESLSEKVPPQLLIRARGNGWVGPADFRKGKFVGAVGIRRNTFIELDEIDAWAEMPGGPKTW